MTTSDTPARLVDQRTVTIAVPPAAPIQETHGRRRWFMVDLLTIDYVRTFTDPETEDMRTAVNVRVQGQPLQNGTATPGNKRPITVAYNDESGYPEGVAEYVTQYHPDKT